MIIIFVSKLLTPYDRIHHSYYYITNSYFLKDRVENKVRIKKILKKPKINPGLPV